MNEDNNLPLVTVITVAFNSAATIEKTINSVLGQSYKNIEYIIIDGSSTDGTKEIVSRYSDQLAYWISEKDSGIYDAMNKALVKSNGNLISILNSDDWYEDDIIEKVVKYHLEFYDVDVIHGILRFIGTDEKPDLVIGHYSSFLDKGMIEHPTCFIKKSLYQTIGYFSLEYKSASDYDWMLRARAAGAKFMLIPEICTNFRRGGMSDSSLGFLEELRIKRKNRIISTLRYTYWKVRTHLKSMF